MARTHSSHTASPTRFRSPQRCPARRPSQDGSQYEMDLDALGLNSTFESTELEGSYEPPADRVDTSDIEGPEDFTMNMTYWMTADLPLAQIKSRKEMNARKIEARTELRQDQTKTQDITAEGNQGVVEESSSNPKEYTASPTMRANGTTADRDYSTPASERSMENDEKVRSFLSALPDTDMEGALTGTPLLAHKQSFLQVPRSSPPKTRSLQATVEDYDTPRKPTQETVIHHTSAITGTNEQDARGIPIADLQSRLEHQELAAKTRITQLETILSYTRAELEGARTDNYRHQERIASLETSMERQKVEYEATRLSTEAQLKTQREALEAKMREFGEEMRLQNQAKLQSQKEDFEQQLRLQVESQRLVNAELEAKGQALERIQADFEQLSQSNNRVPRDMAIDQSGAGENANSSEQQKALVEQLSLVQARADSLNARLEKTTAEARAAHENSQRVHAMHTAVEAKCRAQATHISDLEGHLQTARFELECAQADIAAKQQLFQSNLDLNTRIRTLQAELVTTRIELTSNNEQAPPNVDLESRINSLQSQLNSARADLEFKDQELLRHMKSQEQVDHRLHTSQGRIDSLETTINTLRQQLAEAHRESARLRADAERLERDLEDSNDRIQESRAEASRRVMDIEKRVNKLKETKLEAEDKVRELQARCDDLIERNEEMMEDVRDKAEDAVRKAGALLEQERRDKKRVMKDFKKIKDEVEQLRTENAQKVVQEDNTDEDDSASMSTVEPVAKDVEISSLRDIVRKQVAEMKTLRMETTALRKENKKLKATSDSHSDLKDTITTLESQLATLRTENSTLQSRLEAQESDFEAVNKAMDEKLASLLSKLMKERAKTVVGKRDGQWVETVSKVQSEKELLGKVLLRQWGREEVGVADEKFGERQQYAYQYIKRS
ncbi:Nn.00g080970.m01.CDS01 [Neocucurbitaria sp. VM-36]